MGMSLKRAIKLQGEYVSRLVDLFSSAEIYSYSFDEFLAAKKRIYESMPKALPQHVRAFIDGYESALFKHLQQKQVEFGYTVDGIFYSVWSTKNSAFEHTTEELYATVKPRELSAMIDSGAATKETRWRHSGKVW